MNNKTIRKTAKRLVPKPFLIKGWRAFCRFKARKAKKIFEQADKAPQWLEWDVLEQLQEKYPLEPLDYLYDAQSVEKRGVKRASELLNLVPDKGQELNRFLDLGSWDGMLCVALQQMGKTAVGIDIRTEGLTQKARRSQATFMQMDITELGYADNSFDFVFSYNSFEHFQDPASAFSEALRVVRPGGYIYLNFGPLYWSAKGAHQFHAITVPYCHCLFPKQLLTEFGQAKGLELTGFHWMNEWSLTQYRQLWRQYAQRLKPVIYYETYNADHVDLITRYPSCFKSKTKKFEDLIVAYIEVLFRKVN